MRWWSVSIGGAILLLAASTTLAKPGGHVTEERREYYQKTSQVIDTPVIYATDGGVHSFSSNSDALSTTWAQSHMDQIRKMADRLRTEYNLRAHSGAGRKAGRMRHGYSSNSFDYSSFAGKSKEELDAMTRQMTENMIADMKSGKLLYSQIAQPNYFESQAAQQLESMSHSQDYTAGQQTDQQQHSQNVFGVDDFRTVQQPINVGGYHRTSEKKHYEYTSSHGGYQPVAHQIGEVEDLNHREEQSSIVYPTTVTIIGGNRYVTKKNCSSASSTHGSRSPYFTNYGTSVDRILEKGRTVPIVLDQSQTSTYNKDSESYSKTQDQQQAVPVYSGSYFTDDQYDSQAGQTYDQTIPVQSQTQSQTSETRENSHYNRGYQPIAVPTTSQTFTSASSYVRQHENQQIPVVIPTQQTVTSSSSESYSQSSGQRQIPIVYPSSSIQRESSSYEKFREHQAAVPTPTTSTSRHSIYKHLQTDSDTVSGYQPVVTIDSQDIDTMNQELNRRYQQQPSTIAKTEETQRIHEDRQSQQDFVFPGYTVNVHVQDNENVREQSVNSVRPTIATSQQTTANEHQQSSVQYRPSYPAYGSQINRNDTEFHEKYETRYPQQVVTGGTYENKEEDYYSREHQQQVPIFGQTSQQTEDVRTSETYRSREHQAPVVVAGGSTSYHEEQYAEERQKQVPQKYESSSEITQTDQSSTTHESHKPVYISGGSSQTVETEDQSRESTRYRPYPREHQTAQTTSQTEDSQSHSQTVYGGGSSQHSVDIEDQSRDSTRYRQYPMGHRTTQVDSESEDSYWSQHHRRPSTVQTSQSETETGYSENSRTRYQPGGALITQSSHEQESQSEDILQRPGQAGYTITAQQNETTSSSSSGAGVGGQQTITFGTSQEATDNREDGQVVVGAGYGHSGERNDSHTEWSQSGVYYPGGSEQTREQTSLDQEQNRQQAYGGGMHLEQSEYGSHVNRSMASGGYGIGYVRHQLTIEEQQEEWRRQQEERRRQQLLSTGIFEESSLNRTFGSGGQVQVNIAQQGVYDGDEDRLRNGTAHLDQSQYGSSADKSSTSTSGKPGKIISEDRGDQPPHHYEEDYDINEAEPGIGPYPSEPQIANQRVEPSTTPRYNPPYVAPLAPLVTDTGDQQSTLTVWPTTAGETEVQRTYHRKKTTIVETVPILLGPNGEVIQESGSTSTSSDGQQHGSYQSGSSGSYQTHISGGAALESDSLTQQQENQGQAYLSQSSSQSSGGRGSYGSSAYGSETQYSGKPGSTYSGDSASRYSTGSTSSSASYQGGGSYSQSSAYGHQQQEDDDAEDHGQQLQIGVFDVDDGQQSEDLAGQLEQQQYQREREEELENLRQEQEAMSHSSYSQSADGSDHGQQEEGQSSYYQSHSSYSSQSSGSSGSSSDSPVAERREEQPPEVQGDSAAEQNKPGFWRRVGQKAKDLFG